MLRILDARTGEPVAAAPARRGLTRIEAYASELDPTALRVLLTADLLVRALELGGTPVWTMLTAPRRHAELRTAATALAIRPFEDGRDLASGLGEAQVIHVVAENIENPPGEGPLLAVAPVISGASPAPAPRSPADDPAPDLTALLSDPTSLRLALLSVPRNTAVRLDAGRLGEAARMLARWRRAVAGWARQPSRPVPDEVRARLRAAWEDDLDLPGVLDVLRDVERARGLPDGARFETYVYADRLLALDLARDLGSLA
ncbi:hypothetical protein J2Z21_008014 [Streptomyces griseochromogenes]|uniref:Cysteinyl-tRNA synthetase n=1 Tax=Streptomyces griseochromogenes TaxID=68214 RepID=A0A1B1BDQ5_9ACTN|nr:hypothetical protein [Streptomyces griseochromogenes]ANP56937.1 hypothetical protein AVL59_32860 [Streptomyces griseochromogenes]MBP2055002.1 hypothetical protein [Streptomyces griseochromogenes]